MISQLNSQAALDRQVTELVDRDPIIAEVAAITGMPPLRRRPPGFAGLMRIIVGQQLSIYAAAAIVERLMERGLTGPDSFTTSNEVALRDCGLSGPKIRTLIAAADAVRAGALDLESLTDSDQRQVYEQLTAVTGIGRWTADIFLLFCLGHGDIWPAGDIALQAAVGMAHRLESRPSAEETCEISLRWQPFRSAAAHLMWAYYGNVLKRKALPA